MHVRLGRKELVDDTLELIRLFTEEGFFISEHDEMNFDHLFVGILKKLKIYNESNPRKYGKLAGMGIIKSLDMNEETEWYQGKTRKVIR